MRIKERRRAESHGMQEGKLIGAGPAQHVSLPADGGRGSFLPGFGGRLRRAAGGIHAGR